MKILLIEDDPELRASICQELLRSGWAADCGSDGEEAMLYALNPDAACHRRADRSKSHAPEGH